MSKDKKIVILGAGFSSLAAATYLADSGYDVTIIEKNDQPGGRARRLQKDGFTFDIGPTFYWMPDVFEKFFNDFGHSVSDFYKLERLDPAYQVYFGEADSITIPGSFDRIIERFEEVQPGSSRQLKKFIASAEKNYNIAIKDLVYKPGKNIMEIVTPKTATRLGLFIKTISQQVRGLISDPKLRMILEFPVLFLGAKPSKTPAFYNFMNYADFVQGTWQPEGGMYAVVEAMVKLAQQKGVTIKTNITAKSLVMNGKKVSKVITNQGELECDVVLSGADYAHTETLLPQNFRQYSDSYWRKKTFAPSALLFYVGFNKKLKNVEHHTLFFDTDFDVHSHDIYDEPAWPKDPLFYASFPSITDDFFAPKGQEAGVFLIPLAVGLNDDAQTRAHYFDLIMDRLEKTTQQSVKDSVVFKESFCINDFVEDYNSYGGNAYGLANTLLQTHILRPKLKSKKVKNLYFTGQLTVPGPGVPPSIISGKIVSDLILENE